MKIGVMQPYFFPYIGYWQLLNLVDRYVIYDDVNYIKRGWINRNRILVGGSPKFFNVELIGASQNRLIKEVKVNTSPKEKEKSLHTIEYNYKKAPCFDEVYPLIEECLKFDSDVLSEYLAHSIRCICMYLDIDTEIIMSSDLNKDNSLKGEDKILDICRELDATDYYNAIGGQELYHYDRFSEQGMKLHFLKTDDIVYRQFGDVFYPNLSIIDVLMFNDKDRVKEMLKDYTLVEG